jgi:hypothetical protein
MGIDRLKTEGRRLKEEPRQGIRPAAWTVIVAAVAVALTTTSCTTAPTEISQLSAATHKAFILYRQYAEAPDTSASIDSTSADAAGATGGSPRLTKQYHELGNQIENALAEIDAWANAAGSGTYSVYPSGYPSPAMGEHMKTSNGTDRVRSVDLDTEGR